MLSNTILPRIFIFSHQGNELRLTDPSPEFSTEQVLNFYSTTYPSLTTAKIDGPEINGDEIEYQFLTTLGTKG